LIIFLGACQAFALISIMLCTSFVLLVPAWESSFFLFLRHLLRPLLFMVLLLIPCLSLLPINLKLHLMVRLPRDSASYAMMCLNAACLLLLMSLRLWIVFVLNLARAPVRGTFFSLFQDPLASRLFNSELGLLVVSVFLYLVCWNPYHVALVCRALTLSPLRMLRARIRLIAPVCVQATFFVTTSYEMFCVRGAGVQA
jgi:hypothetical protein